MLYIGLFVYSCSAVNKDIINKLPSPSDAYNSSNSLDGFSAFVTFVLLFSIYIFFLVKLSEKNKKIYSLENELNHLNSKIEEIKKHKGDQNPDKFLIYQIIELLRNISYYSDGQSDSDKNNFDLIKKEIESIINNSGAKEFNPIIGSSVLKDSDLAQRVLVKRKINIRKDSEPIGIIVEVLNKGYSDKNGEVLIKANVVVTARS